MTNIKGSQCNYKLAHDQKSSLGNCGVTDTLRSINNLIKEDLNVQVDYNVHMERQTKIVRKTLVENNRGGNYYSQILKHIINFHYLK